MATTTYEISENLCRKCRKILPIDKFDRSIYGKKGYDIVCHSCREELTDYKKNHTHKICRNCGEKKPFSEFDKTFSCRDGHQKECISCKQESHKRRRQRRESQWDRGEKICSVCKQHLPSYEFSQRQQKYRNICKTCTSDLIRNKTRQYHQEREENGWPLEKKCKKCGKTIPTKDFPLDSHARDGFSNLCNSCTKDRAQQWIEKNKKTREALQKQDKEKKYKECSCCHQVKVITQFNRDSTKKDGYGSFCKICSQKIREKDAQHWQKQTTQKKEKQCRQCKKWLPTSEFSKNRRLKDGYNTLCNACQKINQKSFESRWTKQRKKDLLTFSLDITTEKRCGFCKNVLPLSEFQRRKASKDGYSHYCKECLSKNAKKRRIKRKKEGFAEHLIPKTKICPLCDRVLDSNQFRRDCTNYDGFDGWCKDCRNKKYKEYLENNPKIKKKKALQKKISYYKNKNQKKP